MFTGIVETTGTVVAVQEQAGGIRLTVRPGRDCGRLASGASVAVNGVCLSVVAQPDGGLSFDVVPETLARTNLGDLSPGEVVNLERPLAADGRFDGHVVQGHVDGLATLERVQPEGSGRRLTFSLPAPLLKYVVEKGSICLDGISLTVASLLPEGIEVAVIPHTWEVTNLSRRTTGSRINVEVDILAKYVERLLTRRGEA